MLPMEHALPTPAGHHPWRTIAVVAAGIATLELLGLVVVGTALVAKPVAEKARAAASKPAPAHKTPARPILPRRSVGVAVLNGNGIAGAAATEAAQVRAHGYKIRVVGNAPHGGYAGTMVMYRPGRRPEALRLARDLGIRLVWPLDGLRPRDLRGAQVAVVLGG
jgi:hypothetical protein